MHFLNKFIIGKEAGKSIKTGNNFTMIGATSVAIDSSKDEFGKYQHSHTNSHSHSNTNSVTHSHGSKTLPANNSSQYTGYTNAADGNGIASGSTGHTNNHSKTECDLHIVVCLRWKTTKWTSWTDYDPQTAYHSSNKGNHRHEVKLDHGHQATMNSNPAHAHSLASQSHNHPDSAHSHSVNNEPEYYQLAFIYLEGEK